MFTDLVLDNENEKRIEYQIEDRLFIAKRSPRTGFWTLHNEQGGLIPKVLQGEFITRLDLDKTISNYKKDREFKKTVQSQQYPQVKAGPVAKSAAVVKARSFDK